jgi:ABC-type multidrug transport system ATPase subunit
VAISAVGDPALVYLDEPTTGLDPMSRREIWNSIQKLKKGRVVVLTTHSMEEAGIIYIGY